MSSHQSGHAASSGVPLDAAFFSALMAPFEPFEDEPRVLVAVSGGADSMALAILAQHWCAKRAGKVLAVTVDHGLRAEAADEARWVAAQLAQYGIEHVTLRWNGAKSGAAIQEMARAARYRLIDHLAQERGILHVLVAHHLNDQLETVAMRQNHDSGPVGRAGMSARRILPHCRVLRPLLSVPRRDIEATLRAIKPDNKSLVAVSPGEGAGQPWITDPSNSNRTFERVRIRQHLQMSGGEGGGHHDRKRDQGDCRNDLARLAHARRDVEGETGRFLARCVALDADGVARIDGAALMDAACHVGDSVPTVTRDAILYGMGHILRVVGGGKYAPARDSVARCLDLVCQKQVARHSLGGCVIHRRENHILVYREFGRMNHKACPVAVNAVTHWDERFQLWLEIPENGGLPEYRGAFSIVPLGACDPFHKRVFRQRLARTVPFWANRPRLALASLPFLCWLDQPLSVAGLEIHALSDVLSAAGCPTDHLELFRAIRVTWRFAPPAPLWEGGFKFVANP
ncbi:tRNA lysidine(34) synthetase TilS [Thalassospira sp. TSL5-1]|uniref:tRNA lysidine(34) synthetase TilS n=1 Tax=Thalassospira sp. TSL5-1 TaxID=1544451 RepID=UPI00093F6BF1|nr:tRNA lysidine(34) synthetase TilS [Thalassospira sp. TSL5-1]